MFITRIWNAYVATREAKKKKLARDKAILKAHEAKLVRKDLVHLYRRGFIDLKTALTLQEHGLNFEYGHSDHY